MLLGINQGLAWSATVIMKIDLVGPRQRGLAMGLNEGRRVRRGRGHLPGGGIPGCRARTAARAVPARAGLPALALGLSTVAVHETRDHAALESATHTPRADGRHDHLHGQLSSREVFAQTSYREPALSSASQAGLVNNLNFGLSWGLFPLLFASVGLRVDQIGLLFALYPGVWGVGQLMTGALSDRWGRKHLITAGMLAQAGALVVVAQGSSFLVWAGGMVLLGAGTAMVYPTLLAAVGDVAHPAWRGRAVGVYRVWRDLGYAVGAVMGGVVADLWNLRAAVWVAAAVSLLSASSVAIRMYETHRSPSGASDGDR